MYKIENDIISIELVTKGAELQRIYNKQTHLDYMWDGNPAFWGKHSPILFPIVGSLKNNEYRYNNQTFHLSRHGFARDNEFKVVSQSSSSISFSLCDNEETFKNYPFHFELLIHYTLSSNRINIQFEVINRSEQTMYFSIGAHPAFKVPLTQETHFEDYYLSFNEFENTARYPITESGLSEVDPEIFLQNTDELPLEKSLFYQDALVFKTLQSNAISLESDKTKHGITVNFKGFPFMGIWSAKDADFVCIEPWLGISDTENASGNLEEKEGIIPLNIAHSFKAKYSIAVW